MRRTVIVVTGLAVAGFAGVLAFLTWDQADKVAGVVSAVVAVAALGAACYPLVAGARSGTVEVSGTGAAVATGPGSSANSGYRADGPAGGQVRVADTGEARAEAGGTANSGHRNG
ncbi:hypothetical protein [Kitasatospora cheerisanensis]|uniref:Uncharacterized protein n=1 Tax=Kitasatospora cheerisanensis KCTC 2395 TaxID=1348663 RepID=A0A066ZAT3_9ACTN|nr:hypothetical protein [Kitasatospora cheerisanensis]KDN87230.1 hypothetical protein KCH_10010 [Kitasatospora cheerisanensis KCTC 2395]